jgi:hypothetical protein
VNDAWVDIPTPAPTGVDALVNDYHAALRRAAKAIAMEASCDEQRRIVRAELMVKAGDMPVSKAENVAMASPEYKSAAQALFKASTEAEEAKAEVEGLRVRWETWRSKTSANKSRPQHG